ncbi:pimeloyl-ACP methyl ester carboxylesterase [Crossiella equi]|uniref:Pimeloyl-ACP methyl ester carboxylesterase n=1 Tax=Crossiella equi TaxID=130796 RepID=A0ABS5AJD7_9PSEU|nr:alpha/beta fold hydrolase [Crossiella equi]MBP2476681.1 pimeloyl-ACP methyl ester carboxylesterase [Crossiella equi]
MRALCTALITGITLLTSLVPAVAAEPAVRCSEVELPVQFNGLLSETVHGTLCTPVGSSPRNIQLLVHGGTYNRHYWDLPYAEGKYSYQRDMARRGLATFAIDCLGSGDSSRPLSALVTGSGQANVVHQVVGKLRAGAVGGTRYEKVALVGHSMGSGIVLLAASTYHDVDGVVLTGMSHSMDLLALTGIFVEGIRPALLDPVLGRRGLDPGYLTTMPGTRQVFHTGGAVEAAVVEADELVKDQVAATVVADLLPFAFISPLSRLIRVPVLIANGDKDNLFCALSCQDAESLRRAEAPYFDEAARLSTHLVRGAGHAVALGRDAALHRDGIAAWLKSTIGW